MPPERNLAAQTAPGGLRGGPTGLPPASNPTGTLSAGTPMTLARKLWCTNPEVAVVIRPDRDLPVQKLVALMDALQRAQITKVGIATKAEAK